jgi:hypothetical protein
MRKKDFSFLTKIHIILFVFSLSWVTPNSSFAISFDNLDSIIQRMNLEPYYKKTPIRRVKIAIFEADFSGYKKEIGQSLPEDTHYWDGQNKNRNPSPHGLVMAQIVNSLMTKAGVYKKFEPELFLYRTYGITDFSNAINEAIKQKVDIILYTNVWELGGNGDGKGFINKKVSKAIKAGILWVNAAGNFHDTNTFRFPVETNNDHWVKLPSKENSLRFRCRDKKAGNINKKCHVKIVLAWNDFKNNEDKPTSKDLDLVLQDDTGVIIGKSYRNQIKKELKQPVEVIKTTLEPGLYQIAIKDRSRNFKKSKDEIRVTINTPGFDDVHFLAADLAKMKRKKRDETLLPPADHPKVLSIGALDSRRSSISASRSKPEYYLKSSLSRKNNSGKKEHYHGSSNTAAMFVAALGLYKSFYKKKPSSYKKVLKLVKRAPKSSYRNFREVKKCFQPLEVEENSSFPLLNRALSSPSCQAARSELSSPLDDSEAQENTGMTIYCNKNPYFIRELGVNVRGNTFDQRLYVTPHGYKVISKKARRLNPPSYEIVHLDGRGPEHICGHRQEGRNIIGFKLP